MKATLLGDNSKLDVEGTSKERHKFFVLFFTEEDEVVGVWKQKDASPPWETSGLR